MRKIITSTVLILSFSLFSGSVFADVSDCKEVKGQKALYGLCVAYWNANEKNQAKILLKFEEKSGGLIMPGLVTPVADSREDPDPVFCPCWANGENEFPATYEWLPDEGLVDDTSMFATFEFGSVQFFVEPGFCAYGNTISGFEAFVALSTSQEEDAVCVNDMIEILARDF